MKNRLFVALCLLLFVLSNIVQAQSGCRVLLPAISQSYTGSCKRDLADGTGQASGEDLYTGEFVKGLPDGKGKYVWKNGATYEGEWIKGMRDGNGIYIHKDEKGDSILDGVWKEDKYIGKRALRPYIIEYRDGVGHISCIRTGDRPYIKYVFSRNGGISYNMNELFLQGSSGTEYQSAAFAGFENVTFPFHGILRFSAPNNFYATILRCEVRLIINQPGAWTVTIFY